jgi:hypothetical protein
VLHVTLDEIVSLINQDTGSTQVVYELHQMMDRFGELQFNLWVGQFFNQILHISRSNFKLLAPLPLKIRKLKQKKVVLISRNTKKKIYDSLLKFNPQTDIDANPTLNGS